MKFLVVGLGNPGDQYATTRHNIGFMVLDALLASRASEVSNTSFRTDRLGDVAEIRIKGHTLILLKPSTFMNLSGRAVAYWMAKEKIELSNLIIVSDDIAIDFGVLRLRKAGSAGGHNGLKNICETLGSEQYIRLRVGVGGDFARGHQIDHVLGHLSEEQSAILPEVLKNATDGIEAIVLSGVDRAMNAVNTKKR
ncbi:MAG: aminoacyl-tRNA hydrolase [Mucinivorans sp.]